MEKYSNCPLCSEVTTSKSNFCPICGFQFISNEEYQIILNKVNKRKLLDQFQIELSSYLNEKITVDSDAQKYIVEKLMKENKNFRKQLNFQLLDGNINEAMSLVNKFFEFYKFIARECKVCTTVNIILSNTIQSSCCYSCQAPLLAKVQNIPKHFLKRKLILLPIKQFVRLADFP